MSRRAAIVFLTCFMGLLVIAATAKAMLGIRQQLEPHHKGDGHRRVIGHGQVRFDGAGPEKWALRFRRERELTQRLLRRLTRQRYVVLHRPDVVEAINLAAATYGYAPELWRKAKCESGLNRYAQNASGASGLFQFLPSTWQSTPYAGFSIFDPFANALAAGWMHAHGRGGEWVCR